MKTKASTLAIVILLAAGMARADVWSTNLPCFRGGSYDGWYRYTMTNNVGLGGPLMSLSSGRDQVFAWTAIPTLAKLTIAAEDPKGMVTNSSTIRVSVPTAWPCRFDTGASITYGGNAAGKVGGATFSGDGRSLLIPVTQEFMAGDALTVSGLKMADLRLIPDEIQQQLELDYTGDGVRDIYDQYFLQVRVLWAGGAYDGWKGAISGLFKLLFSCTFFSAR